MPGCVLRYCTSHARKKNKNHGVTYHVFPARDNKLRERWIKFVQKNRSEETWLPTKFSSICSLHFKEDDKYVTKTGRVYLKKSAVPLENPVESENEPGTSTPLSESVSEESIFDSVQVEMLKNQLRKESSAKTILAEKLKKVRRQNKYLKQKCYSYKALIKHLKNKIADLSST